LRAGGFEAQLFAVAMLSQHALPLVFQSRSGVKVNQLPRADALRPKANGGAKQERKADTVNGDRHPR